MSYLCRRTTILLFWTVILSVATFIPGGMAYGFTLVDTVTLDTTVDIRQDDDSDDLVVELMQTGMSGRSSVVEDALVFRVRAFDPRVGDEDGDGISFVDMIILDEDGDEVYRKRETAAGYCAFGGGTPNCAIYNFENNDNEWPNGEPIRSGEEYTLRAIVNANDGRRTAFGTTIEIRLNDDSDDLVVELMQTGTSDSSSLVEDALVFRVRAFDPRVGDEDGDGISFVDMIILDEDGDEVYRKRENAEGYCAFGGGTPNCAVYNFENNDNEWPNGEPIRSGEEYTLRAIVNADDGRRTTFNTTVEIRTN